MKYPFKLSNGDKRNLYGTRDPFTAFQMRAAGLGKAELARRLSCQLPQIDRLLDIYHASGLNQLEQAFSGLGQTAH